MSEKWVHLETLSSGVVGIRIAREGALNALNTGVLDQLEEIVEQCEDSPEIRVAIITGSGDRAFVAGADIAAISQIPDAMAAELFATRGQHVFERLAQSRIFFIAAINGYALGGGLELAMALDLRIASDKAHLGQPEINLGIIPGFGGTQRLSRLVGPGRALWMVASGEPVTAEEAQRIGLVDYVVPHERLMEDCLARAGVLASKAPLALHAAKRLIRESRDWPLEEGLLEEAKAFSHLAVSEDGREGTQAFLNKRQPTFRGE